MGLTIRSPVPDPLNEISALIHAMLIFKHSDWLKISTANQEG